MKTNELIGTALDWAVAQAEGLARYVEVVEGFKPTTDWAQGGPIIERERIELHNVQAVACDGEWIAHAEFQIYAFGQTPLIAAMRCYVASKLGAEVEILEELK